MENKNNLPVDKLKIWEEIKQRAKETLGESVFNAWFCQMRSIADNNNEAFILEVPDAFFKEWVIEHYQSLISNMLKEVSGRLFNVEFRINSELLKMPDKSHLEKYQVDYQKTQGSVSSLNSLYIFDNFVVGNSNRFAYAASLAVAESPSKTYNPLFIYGGVGLGKTHLVQAICHFVQQKAPGQYKICYVSSEIFTNELIDAIGHRTTANFRQKYRNTDVLVIDDIQFIAGKESTQEEFFHTFNTLYDSHKQIIISSDRPPKEIPRLEERLISRFGWGLITDVQLPDYELRVAILKKKLERESTQVPDDVIEFIAQAIKNNIRELEGALIRIIAYSLLEDQPISLVLAKEILKDLIKEENKIVDIPLIQRKVAEFFNVSLVDLKADRRQKNIVTPRQVAMFLARELTNYSLPEIGKFFNGKDHTTVLYSYNKIKRDAVNSRVLKNQINKIIQEIKR